MIFTFAYKYTLGVKKSRYTPNLETYLFLLLLYLHSKYFFVLFNTFFYY